MHYVQQHPTKHVTTKRAPCIRSWSILKQFSFDSVVVLPKFIKILFILISGNLETFYFLNFQKHFLLGMLKNWTTELQNEKWWMPHQRLLWLLVCVSSLCKYALDWFLEEGQKKEVPFEESVSNGRRRKGDQAVKTLSTVASLSQSTNRVFFTLYQATIYLTYHIIITIIYKDIIIIKLHSITNI